MIAADVTDLLAGFRETRLPSGVTRVQTRLVGTGAFPLLAHDGATWRRLDPARIAALIAATTRPGTPRDADWLALLDTAFEGSIPHPITPGDWLLGAGAAWWLPGHAARIAAAKREGLRYASIVYDMLPFSVPEHVSAGLLRAFTQHAATLCLLADHAICISEAARAEFQLWQPRILPGIEIPADVMRLDARFEAAAPTGPVPDEPFVLAVGSVESRKNQLGVLRAWLHLARTHGEAAVPRLVIVGIAGFLAEQCEQLLASAPELRRRVEWRRAAADGELAALYKGCLFTLFFSHAEGWGLPATESLAHGKVPLLADIPVLRESGGAHAVYVPPENVPALAEAAWALAHDHAGRAAREAAIHADPGLRSWPELAAQVMALLRDTGPPPPRDRARLALGERLPMGLPPAPDLPALPPAPLCMGALLREGAGWSHQEDWGCWITGDGPAQLRLPLPPGAALTLEMEVLGPGPGHAGRMRQTGSAWQDWRIPGGPGALRLEVTVPADGVLVVEFDVRGGIDVRPDHRRLGLGIASVTPRERRRWWQLGR